MDAKIREILQSRGEATFDEVCAEAGCFSHADRRDSRASLYSINAAQLGECEIIGSTILFPRNVGMDGWWN